MQINRGNGSDPVSLNGDGRSAKDLWHLDEVGQTSEPKFDQEEVDSVPTGPWYQRPSGRTALWVVGVSSVMAVAEMFKTFVSQEAQHHSVPLSALFVQNFPWWISWAVLSPVIFWLAGRFRLDERGRFLSRLPIHFIAAAVLAAIHIAFSATLYFYSDFSYLSEAIRQRMPTSVQVTVTRWMESFLIMDMLTYGLVLGAYYVIDYQNRLRQAALVSERLRVQSAQLQHRIVEARLAALRMELNPHFLFNALNSISGLVRKRENGAAIRMIASLGDLLRSTLERGSQAEMPLGEELRLVELYLNVARVRFGERLKSVVDVPPALVGAMVPTLALQPLVENAVRHGIGETELDVTITISAKQVDDTLVVFVSDTGPGLSAADDGGVSEGIGLSNTRSRLEQLYGKDASLTVSNVLAGGAVATIRLPLRMKREETVSHG